MTSTATTTDPAVRELPLEPDGEVRVSLPAGSLRVRAVDEAIVRVRARDAQPLDRLLEVDAGPGVVTIAPGRATVAFGGLRIGRGFSADLEIDVPRHAMVAVHTASADVEADGCAGRSDWTTASGRVRLRVAGSEVGVQTVSGDIDVDASAPLDLRVRSVSGDLRIRAPRVERLELGTTSGDAAIEAALGPGPHELETISGDVRLATGSPVRVEARTVTGDVHSELEHRLEGRDGIGAPRTVIVGGGTVPVRWRSMSGDLLLAGGPAHTDATDDPERETAAAPATAAPVAAVNVVAEGIAAPNLASSREARRRTERQEEARLAVLRAVEQGELTIDEASRRLEALDEPGALAGTGWV